MKVLLFGGAGYIGTHVALAFLERGDEVGIYDNLSTGLESNVSPKAKFYLGDILDREHVREVLSEGWDVAVHPYPDHRVPQGGMQELHPLFLCSHIRGAAVSSNRREASDKPGELLWLYKALHRGEPRMVFKTQGSELCSPQILQCRRI